MSCLTPERKSGGNLQAPRVRKNMLSHVSAAGQELGSEPGFLMSLGLVEALTIFILEEALAASLQWCPSVHEQKVHSYMYIIGVFLLTKANQAADWKSRTDSCDECTMGQRVMGCNEICQFKS